ncbi:MAG: hypothetical protein AB1714_24830 [Acidobacteriota bacterium]
MSRGSHSTDPPGRRLLAGKEPWLRRARIAQYTCWFALGAVAVLAQSLFLRESLVVFFGNELSIAATLTAWFLGISVGAAAGATGTRLIGRAADRIATLFAAAFALLLLLLPASLVALRASRLYLGVGAGELVPIERVFLSLILTVTPCSALIGFLFPCAAAMAASGAREGVRAITAVYAMESIGSLAGGAVFTLLLLPRVSSFASLASFAAMALASVALLLGGRTRRAAAATGGIACAAIILSLLAGLPSALDRLTVALRWSSFRNGLALRLSLDSPYENIVVAGGGPFSLFTNGQIAASFPDEYGYAARVHPLMLEHPAPRKVLLLGGGICGILREVLRHPVRQVHVVEADPWLPGAVHSFLPPEDRRALEDPRVTLYTVDPRRFASSRRGKYDLVLLNFPDPSTAALNRFYTREFFAQSKRLLAPGGVLVTRISSASNYLGGAALGFAASIYWTLKDVFAIVLATPGEENILIASDSAGSPSLDPALLKRRLRERSLSLPFFYPEQIDLLLPADRIAFQRETLEAPRDAPRNTDSHPVTYFYGLVLWERFTGARRGYSLGALVTSGRRWTLPLAFGLLSIWAAFALSRRSPGLGRTQAIAAITTTGFASMAWSLLLLLTFQNLFGSLYSEVALLVAVFMLGLAGGAVVMQRAAYGDRMGRHARTILLVSDATIALFSLVIVGWVREFASVGPGVIARIAVPLLLLLSGLVAGAQFPAASALFLAAAGKPAAAMRSTDIGRASGMIDAADHVGALLGAFLTGIVLVPLTGLAGTACVVALAKLASLATLIRRPPAMPANAAD